MEDQSALKALRQPAEKIAALEIFAGQWHVEGRNLPAAPADAESKLNGTEIYEWLAGNHFMVYHWDRRFATSFHKGIGILGYEQAAGNFYAKHYDNLGFARTYTLIPHGNGWEFSGETERASIEFSEDGKHFNEKWESLQDGTWQPICELEGTRID